MVWPVKRTPINIMMSLDNSTVTSKENPKIRALRGEGTASPPPMCNGKFVVRPLGKTARSGGVGHRTCQQPKKCMLTNWAR